LAIDPDAGYIKLNVSSPGAKNIDVDYHDVKGLFIVVYNPQDQELETFEWNAEEGAQSYLVQVNTSVTYGLSVTHISEDDGEAILTGKEPLPAIFVR
jgi:hypothetical protein